jgi:hypothetical protein
MKLSDVKFVRIEGTRLHLEMEAGNKLHFERALTRLFLESSSIRLRTTTEYENAWTVGDAPPVSGLLHPSIAISQSTEEPFPSSISAKTTFSVSADLQLKRDRLYGFHDSDFLGKAEKFSLYLVSGAEKAKLSALFFELEGDFHVAINVVLPNETFNGLFKPLWLGVSNAVIQLDVEIVGYEWGPEGAFGDPDDPRTIILRQGNNPSSLRSLSLTTHHQSPMSEVPADSY